MKEHIRAGEVAQDGSAVALCGARAEAGQWKAGAAYQGLRILGMEVDKFCPECQREWLRVVRP